MNQRKQVYTMKKVKSNQKDILISQLKAENFELKMGAHESSQIKSKLSMIESNLFQLQKEKSEIEEEFKKNEINYIIQINKMKEEILSDEKSRELYSKTLNEMENQINYYKNLANIKQEELISINNDRDNLILENRLLKEKGIRNEEIRIQLEKEIEFVKSFQDSEQIKSKINNVLIK